MLLVRSWENRLTVISPSSPLRQGDAAYLNCPMNREQYLRFWQELCSAQQVELKVLSETAKFFEACLPIEELARRGEDTMRYGPLKPVGLFDARKGISAPQRIKASLRGGCGKKMGRSTVEYGGLPDRIYAGVSRSGYFS